jgi:hypothetical protein
MMEAIFSAETFVNTYQIFFLHLQNVLTMEEAFST